jgi:uncharacterized protein RhaS with RHS repeats
MVRLLSERRSVMWTGSIVGGGTATTWTGSTPVALVPGTVTRSSAGAWPPAASPPALTAMTGPLGSSSTTPVAVVSQLPS